MDRTVSLFNLTIEEFIKLNREVIAEELQKLMDRKEPNPSDIIFLEEAMELIGYKKSTIYSKVSKLEIPCISRKKPLTFSRKALTQWIREGRKPILNNLVDKHIKRSIHK